MSGILHGERGQPSAARWFLAAEMAYLFAAAPFGWDLSEGVHTALVVALAGWAAGPRVAEHLGSRRAER